MDDVADYMYTENLLEILPDKNDEIKHIASFVAGEIRTDCEVCFDSERLRQKDLGIYSAGKLKGYRSCGNIELKGAYLRVYTYFLTMMSIFTSINFFQLGPFPTPRGLSIEFTIRNKGEDNRVRVLVAYSPSEWIDVSRS